MTECPWLPAACPRQLIQVTIKLTFKVKSRLAPILNHLDLSLKSNMTEPRRTTFWTVVMTARVLKQLWSLDSTRKKSTEITKKERMKKLINYIPRKLRPLKTSPPNMLNSAPWISRSAFTDRIILDSLSLTSTLTTRLNPIRTLKKIVSNKTCPPKLTNPKLTQKSKKMV